MKIKAQYKIRKIAGESIILNQGQQEKDMTHIISLNSSAELLFNELKDKEFQVEDAMQVLVDHYHIDYELAQKDAQTWIDRLKSCAVIED